MSKVEHPVTEAANPGLDIVELMIRQGIAQHDSDAGGLPPGDLDQARYMVAPNQKPLHAIEARIYCENPAAQFKPGPGVLQFVELMKAEWLRVESWVNRFTIMTNQILMAYRLRQVQRSRPTLTPWPASLSSSPQREVKPSIDCWSHCRIAKYTGPQIM